MCLLLARGAVGCVRFGSVARAAPLALTRVKTRSTIPRPRLRESPGPGEPAPPEPHGAAPARGGLPRHGPTGSRTTGERHEILPQGTLVPGATRRAFVNITPDVERCLAESGIHEGLCLVNAMHITASVFINDDNPACTTTTRHGWSAWGPTSPCRYRHNVRRGQRRRAHETSDQGREVWWPSTAGAWTSAPGSASSTASSTGGAKARAGQDHRGIGPGPNAGPDAGPATLRSRASSSLREAGLAM